MFGLEESSRVTHYERVTFWHSCKETFMPETFQIALRSISLSEISTFEYPTNKIQTDEDVQTWRQTQSYQDLSVFLHRLNESVVGVSLPWSSESPSKVSKSYILGSIRWLVLGYLKFNYSAWYFRSVDRRNSASGLSAKIWKPCFPNMGQTIGGGRYILSVQWLILISLRSNRKVCWYSLFLLNIPH